MERSHLCTDTLQRLHADQPVNNVSILSYDHCGHGLSGSHLLRELTFIVDSNRYRWARNMKKRLTQTGHTVASREKKCLTDKEYANLQQRYRNILTRGSKELPEIPPKPKGERGRLAKSDAHNLWERLKKHEASVLLFAKQGHVPFTNNRAERDLRMAKVKQKVSGCFRKQQYAHAYCRISSYLPTMAARGVNPLFFFLFFSCTPDLSAPCMRKGQRPHIFPFLRYCSQQLFFVFFSFPIALSSP